MAQINFIMSQHLGECFLDTLQNILYFADFFRDKFSVMANRFYEKYSKQILEFTEDMITDLIENLEINNMDDINNNDHNKFIINFFEKTIRRYIFIKLQEKMPNSKIYELFDVGEIKSELIQKLKELNNFKSYRRRSLDNNLGILISQQTNKLLNFKKSRKAKIYEAGFDDEEQYVIFNIFKKSIKFFEKIEIKNYTYNSRGYISDFNKINTDNLLAILYIVNCPEYAHAFTLVKNNGEFYLLDNNIGKAIKCYNSEDEKKIFFDKIKCLFRITYYSNLNRGYFLGDYKIHVTEKIPDYIRNVENIYTSHSARFFYKLE